MCPKWESSLGKQKFISGEPSKVIFLLSNLPIYFSRLKFIFSPSMGLQFQQTQRQNLYSYPNTVLWPVWHFWLLEFGSMGLAVSLVSVHLVSPSRLGSIKCLVLSPYRTEPRLCSPPTCRIAVSCGWKDWSEERSYYLSVRSIWCSRLHSLMLCYPVLDPQTFFFSSFSSHFRGLCHREAGRIFYNCY